MLILDAAKRASAKKVTIVIPYFGYGRQDRKDRPRVPISSRVILDMAVGLGADRIVSMDLHSSQIQGFVNVPFDHLYSRMALFKELKKMNLNEETGVVLAPDVGSAKMSQAYAKSLGISFALIDKRRPKANEAIVANLVGSQAQTTTYRGLKVLTTTNNSSYSSQVAGYTGQAASQYYMSTYYSIMFDVTDVSNCKVKVQTEMQATGGVASQSWIEFFYLGVT